MFSTPHVLQTFLTYLTRTLTQGSSPPDPPKCILTHLTRTPNDASAFNPQIHKNVRLTLIYLEKKNLGLNAQFQGFKILGLNARAFNPNFKKNVR